MKQHLAPLRPATAALFAALALSTAPVFAQDTTTTAPPPPVINAPPPTITAPPPVTVAPPVAAPAPTPVRVVPAPAPEARATPRAAPRVARAAPRPAPVRAAAPVRVAAPAPAPAPAEVAPAPAPAPVAAAEAPQPLPVETPAAPAEAPAASNAWLTWAIAGGALLIIGLALIALLRRRRPADVYEEEYVAEAAPAEVYEEPVGPAPVAIEPVFVPPVAEPRFVGAETPQHDPVSAASLEEVEIVESDAADVEALAADLRAGRRPALARIPDASAARRDEPRQRHRPVRADRRQYRQRWTARDVRISTWMVAAGEGTDMERSLIEPPADATRSAVDIDAGDGARVEAQIAMAKDESRRGACCRWWSPTPATPCPTAARAAPTPRS